jgi:hypothetical protein
LRHRAKHETCFGNRRRGSSLGIADHIYHLDIIPAAAATASGDYSSQDQGDGRGTDKSETASCAYRSVIHVISPSLVIGGASIQLCVNSN